jgi:hypothetical protein
MNRTMDRSCRLAALRQYHTYAISTLLATMLSLSTFPTGVASAQTKGGDGGLSSGSTKRSAPIRYATSRGDHLSGWVWESSSILSASLREPDDFALFRAFDRWWRFRKVRFVSSG